MGGNPHAAHCARRVRTRTPKVWGTPAWNAAFDSFFEASADGRTPRKSRHRLHDARFNFDALLDKGRTQRNKGTRPKPILYERIHDERTAREDKELELLVVGFRTGASGQQHEGR